MIEESPDFLVILQHHPHIAKKIEFSWGNPLFYKFFDLLMVDTRNDIRQGFNKEVSEALFRLYNLHSKDYPQKNLVDNDVWACNSRFGTL